MANLIRFYRCLRTFTDDDSVLASKQERSVGSRGWLVLESDRASESCLAGVISPSQSCLTFLDLATPFTS
eukprot:487286-Rhodomonas_salina.2